MPIFSKRHYEWLANELRLERKALLTSGVFIGYLDDHIYYLSKKLEAENTAFSRARFIKAIFESEQEP